jgi:hypothetical protein
MKEGNMTICTLCTPFLPLTTSGPGTDYYLSSISHQGVLGPLEMSSYEPGSGSRAPRPYGRNRGERGAGAAENPYRRGQQRERGRDRNEASDSNPYARRNPYAKSSGTTEQSKASTSMRSAMPTSLPDQETHPNDQNGYPVPPPPPPPPEHEQYQYADQSARQEQESTAPEDEVKERKSRGKGKQNNRMSVYGGRYANAAGGGSHGKSHSRSRSIISLRKGSRSEGSGKPRWRQGEGGEEEEAFFQLQQKLKQQGAPPPPPEPEPPQYPDGIFDEIPVIQDILRKFPELGEENVSRFYVDMIRVIIHYSLE